MLRILFAALFMSSGIAIKISTKLGDIQGVSTSNAVHQFLNIPYAEPPVGDLRWRPPQSLLNSPWKETYDATKWGNACTQPTKLQAFYPGVEFVEDCLYLNVFSPFNFEDESKGTLRPVMVYIHGGGLVIGTASSPITQMFNASHLAIAEDIVVVTINYRLGRAAWFVDPQLDGSPTGNGAANGFLDMIEALKWVQHNIESFGGNPNEVTIAGESGGGWAVCGLVASPLARGLFKRSIQMSGSCLKSVGRLRSMNEGMKFTKMTADFMNVSSVEEMRSLDMQSIIDAGFGDTEVFKHLPAVDGYVFPMDSLKLYEAGYVNGESVMIGTNFRESFPAEPWNVGFVPKDNEDLLRFWTELYHDSHVKDIAAAYPVDDIKGKIWNRPSIFDDGRAAVLVSTQLQTDCSFRCGSILQTELIANNPITKHVPVYFYQYGFVDEPWDQVSHGQIERHVFGGELPEGDPNKDAFDKFTRITQDFIGTYIRGEGAVDDASIQNGKYIQVVDRVKAVDLAELDMVRTRCEVMFGMDVDAFDSSEMCWGMNIGKNLFGSLVDVFATPPEESCESSQ